MNLFRLRNVLRYYLPVAIVGVAGVAMLPGDQNAKPSAEHVAIVEPVRPSYLVAVPEPSTDALPTGGITTLTVQPTPVAPTEPDLVETAALSGADQFPMDEAPAAEAGLAVEPGFAAGANTATIASDVNMRAGPSTSTQTLTVLKPGDTVRVVETYNGWVNIVLADGRSGWVYSRYISGAAAEAAAAGEASVVELETSVASDPDRDPDPAPRGTIRLAGDVALRDSPSSGGQRMFRVNAGERVTIAEERGEWVRISVGGGPSGWVRRSDLR